MVLIYQSLATLTQTFLFVTDDSDLVLKFAALGKCNALIATAFFLLFHLLIYSFDEAVLLEVSALEKRMMENLKSLFRS